MALSHIVAPPGIPLGALLCYSFLVGNWSTALHSCSTLHGYLPLGLGSLWSTGVQEQFYVFWPLLVLFAPTRKAMLTALVVVFAVSQFAIIDLCLNHAQQAPSSGRIHS